MGSSVVINNDKGVMVFSGSSCVGKSNDIVTTHGSDVLAMRYDMPNIEHVYLTNQTIQWCPYGVPGYLEEIDDKWYLNGEVSEGVHLIISDYLFKILNKNNDLFEVILYCTLSESFSIPGYLVKDQNNEGNYSFGGTEEEARKQLKERK